jgi:hypothetical protein
MEISSITTIIISILSSSVITLLVSSYIIEPMKEKRKYIFDEKKRVYESIIIFAQIVLYPNEAKFALGVQRYDIQKLSNEQNVINALNDLKMAIPKLMLITKSKNVVDYTNNFIEHKNEITFNQLIIILQKDLYK